MFSLMKYTITTLMILISQTANCSERKISLTINNPSPYTKTNVPAIIKLSEIPDLDFSPSSAVIFEGAKSYAYQLDDLDHDGKKDELCFLYDISGESKKVFDVTLSDTILLDTEDIQEVYCELLLDDQKGLHPSINSIEAPGSSNIFNALYHHGVAFESEFTCYRIYFDHRQNIDIYGKRKHQLELSETHFYTDSIHQSKGYGNDVLWAGNSIGCGSLKLWLDGRSTNWDNVETRSQRILSNGPIRTIVSMSDAGIAVGQDKYDITTIYTQYAKHRDIIVDVYLNKAIKTPFLCTGVQKVGISPSAQTYNGGILSEGWIRGGLAASWGSDYPEMGKKAQYPPEAVGLAVYSEDKYLVESSVDDLNYLLVVGRPGQKHIRYYVSFCSAKEENGYSDSASWFESLSSWSSTLESENQITIETVH